MTGNFLEIRGVHVGYGGNPVLTDIDLAIAEGEFVALLGSSGCGKSTLLRTIAGFNTPTSGTIAIRQRDVTELSPDRRGMALVFQSYALWPHMTVAQNIGYGLKLRHKSKAEIAARVAEMEALLGLSGLGQRKPGALSGGQRQRVALGRALAIDPAILLLDEPLSNLDARIRLAVRHDIRTLQQRLGITAVHVTHDREEAMVMADRIVILDQGRIAQQGTPEDVYNKPASAFVAAFMGAENALQLEGTVVADRFVLGARPGQAPCQLPMAGRPLVDGPVEARFRAEAAVLLAADDAGSCPDATLELAGTVAAVSYPGGLWRHVVRTASGEVQVDAPRALAVGDAVKIRIAHPSLFLFSAAAHAAAPSRSRIAA
ncbi:ATP-binding cassette domain-containing protein [Aurantimonas aggregata]|uniref:ATP-binding cassette domain-containing protein n=1 Tax=Aurantimonas aggregata TaxID=2047720 RepID=A0A6L9ML73_9HYPH|nr:ABC transporter ATP-binding protein [Aurantimonas aggregata]NDV88240.1 ATP-binding cassette domain-containing protein [Aurantimonas aggregata]